MEAIITYILNHYDPGVILIFIAILYIYISSLNKLNNIVITRQDKEEIENSILDMNKTLVKIESTVDSELANVASNNTELSYQITSLNTTLQEIANRLSSVEQRIIRLSELLSQSDDQ